MKLPTLYKQKDKLQQWTVWTEGNIIYTEYGDVGGKLQVIPEEILTGKNIGKKNETTKEQQAEKEALSKWNNKKDRSGYSEEIGIETELISPMLAHSFDQQSDKIEFPCFVQPKLDGIRCIAIINNGSCELWSRTKKRITSLPHIIEELEKRYPAGKIIFDGELFSNSLIRKPFKVLEVKGRQVLLDEEDVPKFQGYTIQIDANGYLVVSIKRVHYYIHRLVMNSPDEKIDHINGNKLDCRKSNLRLITHSQNIANSPKRINNTSGYKGVIFFKRDSTWQAAITKDYKSIHIGYFSTAEEAARAYDKKAKELFGEYASLNFPETISSFETIASAVRTNSPTELSKLIQYHIYDCIAEGDYGVRYNYIKENVISNEKIMLVDTYLCNSSEDLESFHNNFVELGYEGLIIRNCKGKYEIDRRSFDLQKYKKFVDMEFPIIDIEEGRGKLAGHVSAFVCQLPNRRTFKAKLEGSLERLKTLLNDKTLWQGKNLTVKFQGYSKYGIPRFPIGIEIRDYE